MYDYCPTGLRELDRRNECTLAIVIRCEQNLYERYEKAFPWQAIGTMWMHN